MLQRMGSVRAGLLTLGMLLVGVVGCDRSPTEGEDHGDAVGVELYLVGSTERVAHTVGTAATLRWEGSLPPIDRGSELQVEARFLDDQGRRIQLGGTYTVRARLAGGAPSGIVTWSDRGNFLALTGGAVGQTQLIFMLWHGRHSDWDAPPLPIQVR